MRIFSGLAALSLLIATAASGRDAGFALAPGASPGWSPLLRSMGLVESPLNKSHLIVIGSDTAVAPEPWLAKMDAGAVLALEGDSPLAREVGILPLRRTVTVDRITEMRAPELSIEWKPAAAVQVFRIPKEAQVFARVGKAGAPLVAGIRRGRGAILWLAVSPGAGGYERFPYLPQALVDLGIRPAFESRRLWAFFDAGLRGPDIDAEALASGWRKAGVAALHVGAWEYFEPDEEGDGYFARLIAACHRHAILVYAWLELPHVSQKFWDKHPEWREKTARFKDAAVDWRLLMNLENRDCRNAVVEGLRGLVNRFDWDGVNLAELYFDGVDGIRRPAEFTPMNNDVRRDFEKKAGFDPIELFRGAGDPARMRMFLDYRAELAARMQQDWVGEMEKIRASKPGLDLVLTHVDDRFDPRMRDAIGADAASALTLLDRHDLTFIIEDPSTVWHLGPARYAEIARRYAPLTAHQDRVGVDINVVRRPHGIPTKKQTGAELFELIHTAAESFARVAYYFEMSIESVDLPLLPAAAAVVTSAEENGNTLTVDSPYGTGVRWNGPAAVDGQMWPAQDNSGLVWIPSGRHTVTPVSDAPAVLLTDFNGTLESAAAAAGEIQLSYRSSARALALVTAHPAGLRIDGVEAPLKTSAAPGGYIVYLPAGAHRAALSFK